jgi:8-oxo-dGTP diphosphatase
MTRLVDERCVAFDVALFTRDVKLAHGCKRRTRRNEWSQCGEPLVNLHFVDHESQNCGGDVSERRFPSARAYAVAIKDDHVLLVRARRRGDDDTVWWWLPGGGIDFLESPSDAVVREVLEETGLRASNPRLLDVTSDVRTRRDGTSVHTIRIIYAVELHGGELIHESDGTTDLAHWWSLDELDSIDLADYARVAIDLAR